MIVFFTIIGWFIFLGYWLLIAVVALRILIKRRTVSSAIAWLLTIYIFPLMGVIIYLAIGELYLEKRRIERTHTVWACMMKWLNHLNSYMQILSEGIKKSSFLSVFKLCENHGMVGIKSNHLQLLTDSNNILQVIIRDIQLAQHNIEMIFYIWQPGGLVDLVAKSLIDAEKRGVHCRLILDSVGSVTFFRSSWLEAMRNAGIEIVEALKLNFLCMFFRRVDLRQHRKMILIDNHIAYTGSMNMVDPLHFKQDAGVGQWIDIMTRIEGPISIVMGMIYSCDWEIETGERILPHLPSYINNFFKKQTNEHNIYTIASGPGFSENLIHQVLLTAAYTARTHLIITTPYFVPSDDLLYALCTAAQRGVDVSIILPRKNDSMLVEWASRFFFSELLMAGVKIYQFKNGLLHTKSMLVDGEISLIGTFNFDMRSLWLNFEITLIINDDQFNKDLAAIQNNYISHSHLLDIYLWNTRPIWHRVAERFFYFFSPLL